MLFRTHKIKSKSVFNFSFKLIVPLCLVVVIFFHGIASKAVEGGPGGTGMSGTEMMMAGSMVQGVVSQAGDNEMAKYTGSALSAAMGAYYYNQWRKSNHTDTFSLIVSIASFAGAALSLQSAKQDKKTKSDAGGGGGDSPEPIIEFDPCTLTVCDKDGDPEPGGPDPGPDNDPNTLTPTELDGFINSKLADLRNKGYEFNNGSVKTPGGKSIPTSSLGTAGGIASALGISTAEAQKLLNDAQRIGNNLDGKVRVSSMALDSGGGGYSQAAGEENGDGDEGAGGRGKYGRNGSSRDPKNVVGMTKKTTGGDLVGVKEDNIFEIIHRTYDYMRSEYALPPDYKPNRGLKKK